MNGQDPTSLESSAESFGPVTIEEVAALGAVDAANLEAPAAPEGATEAGALPVPIPIPMPPFPTRPVSARYHGTTGAFHLELRVDVDRVRPMKCVSGDFMQISGATSTYFGSFVIDAPTISLTASAVVIAGKGRFTFNAGAPIVRVTIQRRPLLSPPAPAAVQFFTTTGSPGALYNCAFESLFFRTVRIETDRCSDVTTPLFNSYDTGSLPSGGPARVLSVVSAYAEAGIQLIPTTGSNVVDVKEARENGTWSNAELHASMETHFTLWKDLPEWAVWEFVARQHDLGTGLYGIMFDQQGRQRQGCAVFHAGIGGTTPEKLRLQLYTYVHELGHCFNLMHSWQKSFAIPPKTDRPKALSWMNYPWNYPDGGATTFWNNFPFQFDPEELIHLRHAFRNDVIMGGNDFRVGASMGREIMQNPVADESGLKLTLSTHHKSFALGEPVVVQIHLTATTLRGRKVHTWLHPNCGLVKIAIRNPSGEVAFYAPFIDHLVGERYEVIGPSDVIRDSAYIGFGKKGLYFDQPGRYQVRAVYAALDGSPIVSDTLEIRVRHPVTAADEELADLFMGEEQGTLLYLLGSDAESLKRGNDAFDEVLAKYPKHALANYARLVKGMNASREFKLVSGAKETRLTVRKPRSVEGEELLSAAAESEVIDAVSTEMILSRLLALETTTGDETAAAKTRTRLTKLTARVEAH